MKKNSVLLISSLPPPHGGIATWTKKILTYGLPDKSHLLLVNTRLRGQRNPFDLAFNPFIEIYRNSSIIFSLFFKLLIYKPRLVHLSCSLSSVGIFRDLFCAILVKLFRIPLLSHYRGNVPNFSTSAFKGFSQKCLNLLIKNANINIVENQFSMSDHRIKQLSRVQPVLLPNFIDDDIFQHKVLLSNNIRPRALFVGAITQAKGCADIYAVAKQLPQIDFYFIGHKQKDMQELFSHSLPNLYLLGGIIHEAVIQEMCRSDFLLFPSYSEGFPLSVVEAMAVGLPIIATKVGAIPEMIAHGQGGFLVEPRDPQALIIAIKQLIAEPALKIAMGKYNREKSFNLYRYSVVVEKLLRVYQQATQTTCDELN